MMNAASTATYQMCRRVIPHMEAQGGGAIVNMSSISAVQSAAPGSSPLAQGGLSYNTAKGAVEAYTKALAVEVGVLNIRVNACGRAGSRHRCRRQTARDSTR